jgi:transposase
MHRRNKYNYEFRLKCVQAVLDGHRGIKAVAKEKGIQHTLLRLWVMFYEAYGKSGLQSRRNQKYDLAFKLKVVKALDTEQLSLRSAAVRFNIPSDSVILGWQKAFRQSGEAGLISKPKGRAKMKQPIKRKPRKSSKPLSREEELLQENYYLRAENELLKKLQALAQMNKKQKP